MKISRLKAIDGRTFVCSDLHGSYSCLERFLKEIQFKKTKDRLICVGDLVDRGPENEKCLALLNKKWFFSVMGNHEDMMYQYFTGGQYGEYWERNGGSWGTKYARGSDPFVVAMRKLVMKAGKLPYLITVEKKNGGVFHVLHAELPTYNMYPEKITDEVLEDKEKFTKLGSIINEDGDSITWGRYIFSYIRRATVNDHIIRKFKNYAHINKLGKLFNPELSHIYSGHTILKHPVTFCGQTNLDTNAYNSYANSADEWCGLTVAEPETGKFWFVNDRTFKETTPIIIGD